MTSKREIIDALTAAGDRPIEPIAPRLDALEARLMSAIADEDERPVLGAVVAGGATDVIARQRIRRARLTLLAAAASIIAVLVLAFTVPSGADDGLVIAAADGVSIVLADGSEVVGAAGVELSEGARLDVSGSVRVGDAVFGPGAYIVADDQLVRVVSPPTSPSSITPTVAVTSTSAPSTSVADSVQTEPDRPLFVPTIVEPPTSTLPADVDTTPTSTERVRQVDESPTPTRSPATTVPLTRPATTVAVTRPPTTVAETRPPATDAPARPAPTRPTPTRPTTTVVTTTTEPGPVRSATPVTRAPASEAPVRRPPTTIGER